MKKYINSNAFSNYTEEACYWAGLLSADGCIDATNTIRLELKAEDSYQIEKFKKFVSAEHVISYRESTNAYSIRFKDDTILEDLVYNFSVTNDKTYNLNIKYL